MEEWWNGAPEEIADNEYLEARLKAARLRCGLMPPSPERLAEIKRMTVIQILHAGRERVRQRCSGEGLVTP